MYVIKTTRSIRQQPQLPIPTLQLKSPLVPAKYITPDTISA